MRNIAEIFIPYQKEKISVNIPEKNLVKTIESGEKFPYKDEKKVITESLINPIKSKKLSELAKNKKNACILVSDITRPCPSYKFLPYLIDELKAGGIKEINIIFGLGIHRKHSQDEKIKLVGEYAAGAANLFDSEADKCRFIGKTKFKTPVEIYSKALDSDLLIVTGNIEYHYFAGYSGGAKAVMPGIASKNSVQANHSMMLDDNSVAGNFYTNPVRLDMEEAGKMAGIDFLFNVILDDNKRIVAAVCGSNNDAFVEGIKIYDSIYKIEVDSKADLVITSPGGYPKDINLYQAQKALDNVKEIVKDGGIILLVAACPEGFGEDTFCEWMNDAKDFNKLYKKIKEKFVLGGHKAVAISKVLIKTNVYLYSDFDKADTENMGFFKLDDIQEFVNSILMKNNNAKIAVVPNGRFIKFKSNK